MTAPEFAIEAVDLMERPVRLRLPFRFGAATVTHASQAFAQVRIGFADGRTAEGWSAELMVPKWFDKDPALSADQTVDQLRRVLRMAADAYREGGRRTAFGHSAAHHTAHRDASAAAGIPALAAAFGPALLDKAVLDALGRALGASFQRMATENLFGLRADPALCPDLGQEAPERFLAGLRPHASIAARHTVGLLDPILTGEPGSEGPGDGLPRSLEEVVATYGNRHFKLKLSGDGGADLDRLARIAAVLDRLPGPYLATLDGNEQYAGAEEVVQLWERLSGRPALRRLREAVAYVEQPIPRARTFDTSVAALAARVPVIVDEADDAPDAFVRARSLGYAGISSKACKGIYKSLLNGARCRVWNAEAEGPRYFLSAEDLTTQAGLGVQQDLALVDLLGLPHVERNGHHYVDGFGDAPEAETGAFLEAHPDLYRRLDGRVRLRIDGGRIAIGSLSCTGFATAAHPRPDALAPLRAGEG